MRFAGKLRRRANPSLSLDIYVSNPSKNVYISSGRVSWIGHLVGHKTHSPLCIIKKMW